ncbi:MAG: hypothetical protein ACRCV6_04430 [Formosimonas sp.]
MSKVAVLLSHETHPISGKAIAARADTVALALALSVWPSEQVRAVSVNALPESAAREFLAQGVAQVERLAQTGSVAQTLADACHDVPWLVCGAHTAQGTGVLPYVLAEALSRPMIDRVVAITPDGDTLHVVQALAKGARRRLSVSVPCVLSIHPQAPVTPRFAAYAAIHGAIVDVGAPQDIRPDTSVWLAVKQHARAPLKAQVKQSGHSRMLAAVGDSTSASSSPVIDTPDLQASARAVLDYLQHHHLLSDKG